jgi:hypothetical protein
MITTTWTLVIEITNPLLISILNLIKKYQITVPLNNMFTDHRHTHTLSLSPT